MSKDLAVFSRIIKSHADEITGTMYQVTLRSKVVWRAVSDALEKGNKPTIYFATSKQEDEDPSDDDIVRYIGKITDIKIHPTEDDPKTQELLKLSIPSTREEGLWDDKVQTLYVVSDLAKLLCPFPMTDLVRHNKNQTIDKNYQRLYCLVNER